jgi:hypothetical protein
MANICRKRQSIFSNRTKQYYVYDYKTIKEIKPETSFHLSAFVTTSFLLEKEQKGLMRCVNDKLVLIPNSQIVCRDWSIWSSALL